MLDLTEQPSMAHAHTRRPHAGRMILVVGLLATCLVTGGAAVSIRAAGRSHHTASSHSVAAAKSVDAVGVSVTVHDGPFGPMIVGGSGSYDGWTLYMITSDHGSTFGCTTQIQKVFNIYEACTGPETDHGGGCLSPVDCHAAEWRAFTTPAKPVAGPGVNPALLGDVFRPGVGLQVTYGGHPLYIFDPTRYLVTGEGWDEPRDPPWHGVHYAVSPGGAPLAWDVTLDTVTINGQTVLGELGVDSGGYFVFPVYEHLGGVSCTASCTAVWPPLITQGSAALEANLNRDDIGYVKRPDGDIQLTYKGHNLFLYSDEYILPAGAQGSGNNVGGPAGFGGMFTFVTP
jgi:predicted lipoprotein with Yx(FWY)xxD motif